MPSAFADVLQNTATTQDDTQEPPRNVYRVCPMDDWNTVDADFVLTDPPFGIDFDGKNSNYARDKGNVVDGYVEWDSKRYGERITKLLDVITSQTGVDGHGCIFSGYDNSYIVHQQIIEHDTLSLEGKLYWDYNFAPYCTRRPAHNVYEIYWVTKTDDYYYTNECTHSHCTEGEANLSVISVKRNYLQEMPKYPTRLPPQIVRVLLEHFTQEGDVVFDPLAGSGSVGLVADDMDRSWVCGDSNNEAKEVFEKTHDRVNGVISQ